MWRPLDGSGKCPTRRLALSAIHEPMQHIKISNEKSDFRQDFATEVEAFLTDNHRMLATILNLLGRNDFAEELASLVAIFPAHGDANHLKYVLDNTLAILENVPSSIDATENFGKAPPDLDAAVRWLGARTTDLLSKYN